MGCFSLDWESTAVFLSLQAKASKTNDISPNGRSCLTIIDVFFIVFIFWVYTLVIRIVYTRQIGVQPIQFFFHQLGVVPVLVGIG